MQADLLSALGSAPIAVISTPWLFQRVYNYTRGAGVPIPPIDVITISEEVAHELKWEASQCAIFRKEDCVLENFECTYLQFKKRLRSTFSVATPRIRKSKEIVVALYHKNATETLAGEILHVLGGHFQDMKFVQIKETQKKYITELTHEDLDKVVTSLSVLNFTGGYYYNLSSYITEELKMRDQLEAQQWTNVIAQVLLDVRAKKVPKIYRSESAPKKMGGILQRVAGVNYLETVTDPTKDVLALLLEPKSQPCSTMFAHVRKLAEAIEKTGNTTFLFTFCDVTVNQIEGGFPSTVAPSVLLYPAGGSRKIFVLPYASFDVLAWFANRYGTGNHSVPFRLPDPDLLNTIEESAKNLSARLSPPLARVLRDELQDLRTDTAKYYAEEPNLTSGTDL
jgi:hypothetical protein